MKLGHVHLKVTDISSAEHFYCGIVGLTVTERIGDSFVFLSFDHKHHNVALQKTSVLEPQAPRGGIGLYHSAFEVSSSVELLNIVQRLTVEQIPFSLVDHGISWAIYTEDPSGNGIEVYLDRRSAPTGRDLWYGESAALTVSQIAHDARRGL